MLTFSCFDENEPTVCSTEEFFECAALDTSCKQECLEKGGDCGRSCYASCEEKEAAKMLFCSKEFDCELDDQIGYECYEHCMHEIAIMCYDTAADSPDCMWCFDQ